MSNPALDRSIGVHLALGGGAARGLAHLGVIKALQEHQIPIASICGTSMGALVGACFALNPDAEQVIDDFIHHVNSEKFNKARFTVIHQVQKQESRDRRLTLAARMRHGWLVGRSLTTGSILSFDEFRSEVSSLIPDRTFKQLKIPFFAVACDLLAAREVVFHEGYLRSAIMASSAIPGVFPGVQAGTTVYVDGGWINKIPTRPPVAFGAPHVIGIDVSDNYTAEFNPRRGYSMLNQANAASQIRLQELQTEHADLMWRPPISVLHWSEFTQIERAVEIGYEYASAHIHEAEALLAPPPKPTWRERVKQRFFPDPAPKPRFQPGFDARGIWDIQEAEESRLQNQHKTEKIDTAKSITHQ
ncbi:Patatin-like phospholipase family protein [Sulfidibacter corallicola]|uniref:Patatin-like phospholipase family protein n=1 Tax=Sulfidibacter corallicola TaxID=2818388 RepID=A0A8A4TQE6_SULCO|nr:patatin-like phospholipase family protein [Sulfidibacter corallicola]QTD52189.1 patatin-like phospholipase family protein [Sulfidibacter corallicola]